jgi:hypothetical protein
MNYEKQLRNGLKKENIAENIIIVPEIATLENLNYFLSLNKNFKISPGFKIEFIFTSDKYQALNTKAKEYIYDRDCWRV